MKKKLKKRFIFWLVARIPLYFIGFSIFFIFSYFVGEGLLMLTANILFPVKKTYLFTHNKHFDYKESKNEKVRMIGEAIESIRKDLEENRKPLGSYEKLGVFKKEYLEFIRGEREISFYYSEDLKGEMQSSPYKKTGLGSFGDRVMFYFWKRSLYGLPTQAYAIGFPIFGNVIVIGPGPLKYKGNIRKTITHEILHLCWAIEEEIDLIGF